MRERRYILNATTEEAGRNPACKLSHPARLRHRIEHPEKSVESEHAAASRLALVVNREQERVGQQQIVESIGGEVAGIDVAHNLVGKQGIEKQVEQQHEMVSVRSGPHPIGLNRLD